MITRHVIDLAKFLETAERRYSPQNGGCPFEQHAPLVKP
jgi:hypothetical protein